MRRAHVVFLSLIALLVVPIAAAAKDKAKPPKATVTGLTAVSATLQAKVVPTVAGTLVAFEYGTTTDYGQRVAGSPSILPLSGAVATAHVADLAPATTYHYRVVLTVAGVDLPGIDQTFTTQDAPPEPSDGAQEPDKSVDNERAPKPVDAPEKPKLGRTVAVGPRAGTVRVRKPHKGFVTLAAGADLPSGSVVDATHGRVAMTSALGGGDTQTGEFSGGRFLVRQSKNGSGMVDIYLRGSLGRCAAVTVARKHRTRARRLWGRDHGGKYRTHGANSVATVRGTRWLTRDTCAGTLTRVTRGVVSVRDLRRHRTVTVRAGHSYLARRGR
jgi:hypothetical protein